MMDRCLARMLNSTIIALIAITGGVGLGVGYKGLMDLLCGNATGAILMVVSVVLVAGSYHLCQHRRYLADC